MQCDVCKRPPSSQLPFNCTICARNSLYEYRVLLAQTLLQQEAAEHDVEQSLKSSQSFIAKHSGSSISTTKNHSTLLAVQLATAERATLNEKSRLVHEQIEALRKEAHEIRAEIAKKKDLNDRRRKALEIARQELSRRGAVDLDMIGKATGRTQHRWNVVHTKTAESRILLCKEAASLYVLQQRESEGQNSDVKTYHIGGLQIHNLKDLNRVNPSEFNTVIARLVHLIHLISHYLSLRLPAEIILPRRGFPVPTIFSPGSSYISRDTNPNTIISTNVSPSSSHAAQASDLRHQPRPRPLFLNKKLPNLAKDDPYTYSSFIEGVTLLAWNVAWLCKTQGFDVGTSSWNEVCNIGKNLYQLLAADHGYQPSISILNMDLETQGATPRSKAMRPTNAPDQAVFNAKHNPFPSFGQFSHDTVHTNLVTALGTDYMRSWRLQNPIRVIDYMKQMLLSDRTGAGWEILEGKEWEAASNTMRDRTVAAAPEEASTVMVDEKDRLGSQPQARGSQRTPAAEESSQEKTRGTSGWTKLKSR